MDWVTLTRQQIEDDRLPDICMVCGASATDRVNKTFTHTPAWVEHLHYLGFFPGWIASQFFCREMRVSCPVCSKHRTHWSRLAWLGSIGWLMALPVALLGLAVGAAIDRGLGGASIRLALFGAVTGLAVWLVIIVRMGMTRVRASDIAASGSEITFQRVSDAFVRAARNAEPETSGVTA